MKPYNALGKAYESALIAEIVKQVRNAHLPLDFCHLRTPDGREAAWLIETQGAFVAPEIRSGPGASRTHARQLRDLQPFLAKPVRKGRILSMDPEI